MVCSNCHAENRPGRKFCAKCGAPLAVACPACGAPNEVGDAFCGECGQPLEQRLITVSPLGADAAAPTSASPGAERRLVSVLFADLVGFTTLSESRDAEEVRDLLSRYFDTSRSLIGRYGGVVEKFIGDAVMAVWGAPVANEDDAERAVRAALDLVDAVSVLGTEVGMPNLQARAGVLTGEAAVNLAATDQGMVAGDIVNTASRIQAAADPGTVLVGGATRRATEAAVAYEDVGEVALKGKEQPARLYRALRVVAGRKGLMKSEGLEPPFVGRDGEIRLLKEAFHACVEERRAHLVQVRGIAGIGKSRLAWEFFKYMDGLREFIFWHRGRCLAYGEGVTYWALAEMVRGRADILEGEERASALEKLRAALDRYITDPTDRRFCEPRIAHLIGLDEGTAYDRQDLFAAWRLFFERLADQDPVVMVFEDMQWADPALLEFIDYLLDWSRAYPLFVVSLARPDDATNLATAKRNATTMFLEPLSQDAMERLLAGFVPGLPDELTTKILDRAEGVPLYAVETIRMLLDRGKLVQDGPVYRPTGPIEALDVPETLHALIAARLDGLTSEERRLLQDASVLGKTFTPETLAAVAGVGAERLEAVLSSLARKEVLSVQADPRSPERGQYGFLQDLVRSVAYEMLPKRERRGRHLAAAAHLEANWPDPTEIAEVVAAHYLEAYRLDERAADAEPVKAKARENLIRAGEHSARLGAAASALSYFLQATPLTGSPVEEAELLERAGRMAYLQAHAEEAIELFERSTTLFRQCGQPNDAARVQAHTAETEIFLSQLDSATARMQDAFAALSAGEPTPDLAMVAERLGRLLALAARPAEALARIDDALRLAEAFELTDVFVDALNDRGIALFYQGRLRESAIQYRAALDVALESHLSHSALRSYNNLLENLTSEDRFAEHAELHDAAVQMARRAGDRISEGAYLGSSLWPLFVTGRWDEAEAKAETISSSEELMSLGFVTTQLVQVAPVFMARGAADEAHRVLDLSAGSDQSREGSAVVAATWAFVLRMEGRPAEALEQAHRAYAARAELGMTYQAVKRGLTEAIEASFDLGDLEAVQALLSDVERLRRGELTPYLQTQATRLAARLAAIRGDLETARSAFAAAARAFAERDWPWLLAVTLVEHAEHAGPDDAHDERLRDAREILQRLRARPWVERVDAFLREGTRVGPRAVAVHRTAIG